MKNKLLLIGLAIVLVVITAVPGIYFYRQFNDAKQKLANPTKFQQEEARLLAEKVGKLIELPADEQPTIATVTDAARLSTQAFFVRSQNGDKVLIFTNAKKAVLYRPDTNKIIEVAPVNIGENQATPSAISGQVPSAQLPNSTPAVSIQP